MKNFKELRQELGESTPGKPETMAQKHARLQGYDGQGGTDRAYNSQKRFLAFVREVAQDWHSGDMALSRMESLVTSELGWLMHGSSWGDESDPDAILMNTLSREFRKQVKSAGLEPTARLGKGSGFNPSMGKITPNQIGRFFDLVVDFVKNDWTKIEAGVKGKTAGKAASKPSAPTPKAKSKPARTGSGVETPSEYRAPVKQADIDAFRAGQKPRSDGLREPYNIPFNQV